METTEIETRDGCLGVAVWMIMVFICALILIALGGCRSIQYVPVETVKHDSIYINKIERDSVLVKDSIYIKEKNDTVLIEKWKTRYVSKYITDTVYVERVDSVQVPYPVERELSKAEKRYISLGKVSLGVYIGLIVAIIAWVAYRLKKRKIL